MLLAASVQKSMAQQATPQLADQFANRLFLDYRLVASPEYHDMSPLGLNVRLGYKVLPQLSLYTSFEGTLGLVEQRNSMGTYYGSNNLGGGLNVNLLKPGKSWALFKTMDLHATVGTTVGHNDWKYTLYEGGLTFSAGRRSCMTYGLGYRVLHSRTDVLGDHRGVYFTIGYRF